MVFLVGQMAGSGHPHELCASTKSYHLVVPHAQVAQGATLFLTQPPFDADNFAAWVDDARKRGVWEAAQLVVGHPMIR